MAISRAADRGVLRKLCRNSGRATACSRTDDLRGSKRRNHAIHIALLHRCADSHHCLTGALHPSFLSGTLIGRGALGGIDDEVRDGDFLWARATRQTAWDGRRYPRRESSRRRRRGPSYRCLGLSPEAREQSHEHSHRKPARPHGDGLAALRLATAPK